MEADVQRRDVLRLTSGAFLGRLLVGCDRLVILDPRLNPEIDPITDTKDFYTYSCCGVPEFDAATHETIVAHEDQELARFDRTFLESLPMLEKELTLECIGARPRIQNISNAIWGGLPLIDVFDALGVTVPASAVELRITGMDDYNAGIPIRDLDEPVWLAWQINGSRLPRAHGAPARLLVPGRYGVKNLKWLAEIAFVDSHHISYWTSRGWNEAAEYKPNALVASPLDGFLLTAGERVRFVGTAFAGRDPVVAVEASLDGGPWEPCDLDYAPGPDIWCLWSWGWTPQDVGDHTVQIRCFTESGAESNLDSAGTDQFHGYDGSMAVTVTVRS